MIDNKYRVHEVAKDFDIKSNIVIDLLGKYFDDKKKHMTALEPDELDLIFDTFTKENQVEDLNTYFNYMPASKKSEAKPSRSRSSPPPPRRMLPSSRRARVSPRRSRRRSPLRSRRLPASRSRSQSCRSCPRGSLHLRRRKRISPCSRGLRARLAL